MGEYLDTHLQMIDFQTKAMEEIHAETDLDKQSKLIENMSKKEKEFELKLTSLLPKEEVVKEDVGVARKTKTELSKMKESELVSYGLTINADVNTKYTKAKNIENILNVK